MYATTHVLASVVISQHTPNLWWAFFISLLFHYILDFIPHGDRPIERWIKRGPYLARSITVMLVDITLLMIMIVTLYQQMSLPALSITIVAIIGGLLPDILWITYDFYVRHLKKRKLFNIFFKKWYTRFFFQYIEPVLDHHTRIHNYIDSIINTHKFPALVGALIQLSFVCLFIYLATTFWQ